MLSLQFKIAAELFNEDHILSTIISLLVGYLIHILAVCTILRMWWDIYSLKWLENIWSMWSDLENQAIKWESKIGEKVNYRCTLCFENSYIYRWGKSCNLYVVCYLDYFN